MTVLRTLWGAFVDLIKPQLLHSIHVDRRPFNTRVLPGRER
ncbi:hypothetical protein [Duganella sp. P38]